MTSSKSIPKKSVALITMIFLISCGKEMNQYSAWRCMAQKDVMALRVGTPSGTFESISFDGGGMALHLSGERPFAPNYADVSIELLEGHAIRIHFKNKHRTIEVDGVGEECLLWLKKNNLLLRQ